MSLLKILPFFVFLLWIGFQPTFSYAQEAWTLKQCYELALQRSETIAIDGLLIKETEGQFYQSLSGALPKVNYVITQLWQDASGSGESGSNSNLSRIPTQKFTFSQPLFSGFKEFAAIKASKSERKVRENQLERAKQLLFTDVSDAFYYFQSYAEDLQTLEAIHTALSDRMAELNHRLKVGRTRKSELASAESSLYKAEATQEDVRSQFEVARQLLEFLIGAPITAAIDDDVSYEDLGSLDDYLSKAKERPDVKAAQYALEVAQRNITIARAGYWPSASIDANSYTKRVGTSSGNSWDILLTVDIPLFDGTRTWGDVKIAKAREEQARLIVIQTQRRAALEIKNAYTRLSSAQRRQQAIQKSSEAAERNYQLQSSDYKNSLGNNLDVLQALQDWEDARRGYIFVKNEAKRLYWNLKVAVGEVFL